MKTKMNLEGTTRKALVAALEQITGCKAVYCKMPTCNYEVGDITVTKDGCIICPDDSNILDSLIAAGFMAEDIDGLTVSLPSEGFTEAAADNLRKLVSCRAALIRKALDADRLDIVIEDGKVSFPWWDYLPVPEEVDAYTAFLAALYKMAKEATRVTSKETKAESEKYAFRCFLLRLGFIGNGSKPQRKILMKRLSGPAAFPNKEKADAFISIQKTKREAAKASAGIDKKSGEQS